LVAEDKRESAQDLHQYGLTISKSCQLMGLSRVSYYRPPKDWRMADAAVIDVINIELKKSSQAGFWKIFRRIRRKGHGFNFKRVYRVYKAMGLNKPRRTKRVLPKRVTKPLVVQSIENHQWALDFMHDSLYCGKRFRTLNIIDEGTRECLAIEIDTSLPSQRVIRVLEELKRERGLPKQLRLDNGPEFI
jgi:putative transposase